jgi:hypothetical protein
MWFWLNIPLASLFFGGVAGIPMWMVIKHPDTAPDFSAERRPAEADTRARAAQAAAGRTTPRRGASASPRNSGKWRPRQAPGDRCDRHTSLSASAGALNLNGHVRGLTGPSPRRSNAAACNARGAA